MKLNERVELFVAFQQCVFAHFGRALNNKLL